MRSVLRSLRLCGFNGVASVGTAETAGFGGGDCMAAAAAADFDCCRFEHFSMNCLVIRGGRDEYGEQP